MVKQIKSSSPGKVGKEHEVKEHGLIFVFVWQLRCKHDFHIHEAAERLGHVDGAQRKLRRFARQLPLGRTGT